MPLGGNILNTARSNPSLEQVLKNLIAEVLKGRAALEIAVGLSEGDPVVLSAAPVFFGMAYDGNLELAQLYAARLYDRNPTRSTWTSCWNWLKRTLASPGEASQAKSCDDRDEPRKG